MKLKIDPFVLAILLVIGLAYLFSFLGVLGGNFPIGIISSIGVALIFFFYGLKLDNTAIKSGLKNWKLHLVVQGSAFLLFPSIILLFFPLVKDTSYETVWMSFLFMAALPSAVSSSVVMVSLARGNMPAAIFNASISGIIGIIVTPLWVTLFIHQTNMDYNFSEIYLHLFSEIVLPLTLGLLLRRYLGKYARNHTKGIDIFDKGVVLLIIFKSFTQSFEKGIFKHISWGELLLIFAIVIALFFLVFFLTGWISKLLHFNREDQITTQYCGTKKSLIHGTVFSKALFGQSSIIGLLLLPLMIYHAFQIFMISVFALKKGKEYDRRKELLKDN